jgi:hypothetical protein
MKRIILSVTLLLGLILAAAAPLPARAQGADNPNPPEQPVKLIFIHHSTGGNWLADPSGNELGGGLGRALMENNYYVSATNYGWGPDSIGDATDIPNWIDWFRGERSPVYLDALYTENGQNFGDFGSWPRLSGDPGGENVIVMFKSCFPNSELEGNPNDAPDPDGWLSVGHAKYVYNEILQYFGTRPDKLFVVITAPPLTNSSNAANARAFNEWLMNDWLRENNYTLNNVAVFDFYNVLTGPDNHHRWTGGQIEHTFTTGMNTEYYPSGDDHPAHAGNVKATEEFVPLLNIFYHRWQANAGAAPVQPAEPAATSQAAVAVPVAGPAVGTITDLESEFPFEAYNDEGGVTTLTCGASNDQAHSGAQSLKLDFNTAANGWSTCSHFFDSPQDWSAGQGISFHLRSASAGQLVHVDLYAGPSDNRETYYYALELPAESVNAWIPIQIAWADFHRAEWEADANAPFAKPDQIVGIAFGFPSYQDAPNTGTIWVDDMQVLGSAPAAQPATEEAASEEPPAQESAEQPQQSGGGRPGCGGAMALPFALVGGLWLAGRKRK